MLPIICTNAKITPRYSLIASVCAIFLFFNHSVNAAWYDTNWGYRAKVTILSTQVDGSGSHSDFPVLITEADFGGAHGIWSNVDKADGGDIRATVGETTEIPLEVVSFDAAGKTMEIFVRVSSLSTSANTDIYLYYGSTAAQ